MHPVAALTLALAAARLDPGPVRLAALAREAGVDTFTRIHDELPAKEQAKLRNAAESLARTGVSAVLLGSPDYPPRLLAARAAPAFLFCRGVTDLLSAPGLAICGSDAASSSAAAAARSCATAAAELGLTTIAGDGPSVGVASHVAALAAGGRTVLVASAGINRFRLPRGKLADAWDPARTLVVSPFPPGQRPDATTETVQHTVILGLGRALLVIEPQATGTTLATGMRASATGRPVLAIPSAGTPRGIAMLLRRGAIPIHNPDELTTTLDSLPDVTPRHHPLLMI